MDHQEEEVAEGEGPGMVELLLMGRVLGASSSSTAAAGTMSVHFVCDILEGEVSTEEMHMHVCFFFIFASASFCTMHGCMLLLLFSLTLHILSFYMYTYLIICHVSNNR